MRKIFSEYTKNYVATNENSIILLGDISIGLFLDSNDSLPTRVLNVGILEQSMVSFAAGLARGGVLPFVHTISPFLIERAYEQIKLDLSYNKSKCVLVSANGPYEYTKLGPTHHCASDIPLISLLPELNFAVPGRKIDVISAIEWAISKSTSTYIRLTSLSTEIDSVEAGVFKYLDPSNKDKIDRLNIFVGESLAMIDVISASEQGDVLYIWNCEQISFDDLLRYKEINIWEPYSLGVIASQIAARNSITKKIFSYTYPKSIESGIFHNPWYVKTIFRQS